MRYLRRAEMSYPNTYAKFKIYLLRKRIMRHIELTYKELVKNENYVEKVIQINNSFDNIKFLMKRIFETSFQLWKRISISKDEQFKYVQNTFKEIIDDKNKCKKYWEELSNYIHNNTTFILFFHWFNKDIWNQKVTLFEDEIAELGEKNENLSIKSANILQDMNLDKIVFKEEFVVMHINMEIDKIGEIKYVTHNCEKQFGYQRIQLITKNIEE